METAFKEEDRRGERVLFPVRLDDDVLQIEASWAEQISLTRNIGDFTNWKDHDSYSATFDRVLRDLKREPDTTSTGDDDGES